MNDWLTTLGENVESLKQYTEAFTEVPQTIHEIVSGRASEVASGEINVDNAMFHMKNRLERMKNMAKESDFLPKSLNPKLNLEKPLSEKEQADLQVVNGMYKSAYEQLRDDSLNEEKPAEIFDNIAVELKAEDQQVTIDDGNPDVAEARANLREIYNSSPLPALHEEYIKQPEDFGLAA